jgi:hypothetical protein
MLAKLDEYGAILFKDCPSAFRAAFVAGFQQAGFLFCVVRMQFERDSIASQRESAQGAGRRNGSYAYSLMHTANVVITLPVLSAASYPYLISSVKKRRLPASVPPVAAMRTALVGLALYAILMGFLP